MHRGCLGSGRAPRTGPCCPQRPRARMGSFPRCRLDPPELLVVLALSQLRCALYIKFRSPLLRPHIIFLLPQGPLLCHRHWSCVAPELQSRHDAASRRALRSCLGPSRRTMSWQAHGRRCLWMRAARRCWSAETSGASPTRRMASHPAIEGCVLASHRLMAF